MRLRALLLPLTVALLLLGAPMVQASAYPGTDTCATLEVSTTAPAPGEHITDLYYAALTPGDDPPAVLLGRFSARTPAELVPQIETKAKQNIWVSLLLALGLGLILGIWLTGGRRRD